MRVWVQSPGSSNIHVCEFRLEFLSYLKKKKKKKKKTQYTGGQKKIQRAKIKYNHKTPNRAMDLSYKPTDLTKIKPKNKIQIKQ